MRSLGDRLQGVLREDERHPRGRNPYAHVAGCVKERFGCSYGDLPDERVGELRLYLQELEREEGGPSVVPGAVPGVGPGVGPGVVPGAGASPKDGRGRES
jgi:hypothetical protein